MKRLFIGGVAHGRVLDFPEELRVVRVPEDTSDPIKYLALDHTAPVQISTQLYELRRYRGPHIKRGAFVLSGLSDDEVLCKYPHLIFQ